MKKNPADVWLQDSNPLFYNDIKKVYDTGNSVYVTDYELKGVNNIIINYQILPLGSIGNSGVVVLIDHISSEKRSVMTLSRYMPPEVAQKYLVEETVQLSGCRKKVSILFSNIRHFTSLSEHMDAQEVMKLLNNHFTDAYSAISREKGILDKYLGISSLMQVIQ